jgi:Secretion system C-terminal sorting domain
MAGSVSVEIFDVLGRSVKSIHESKEEPGTYHTQVPTQNLANGTYYYKASVGNGKLISGKLIKCE